MPPEDSVRSASPKTAGLRVMTSAAGLTDVLLRVLLRMCGGTINNMGGGITDTRPPGPTSLSGCCGSALACPAATGGHAPCPPSRQRALGSIKRTRRERTLWRDS
ncbi:unnamed protein product [Ectocarpus sp. 12 AP-2014]